MKKVYFASDSYALTGPSIVGKYYREQLKNEFTFSKKSRFLLIRLIKAIGNIIKHKVIIYSGASKSDYILIWLSKILKRKIIYIMHGCIREENIINKVSRNDETRLEMFYLKKSDLVLCVSEQFTNWVKNYYPVFKDKIFPLTNGVDWKLLETQKLKINQDMNILSIVGGGVPRKNVKSVCEAISRLNNLTGKKYQLKVFGRDDIDTEIIRSYDFVKYYGKIEREQLFKEIAETSIFIQNSIFDSFAMAPLEALFCGCSILCSKNVGALSLFQTLKKTDVIEDCFDINEIVEKILYVMKNKNHDRLLQCLDKEKTSYKHRADELRNYVKILIKE